MRPNKLWRLFKASEQAPAPTPPTVAPAVTPASLAPTPSATGGTVVGGFNAVAFNNIAWSFSGSVVPLTEKNFSGKDFAIGTAKGARSFRIDALGRLTGINFRRVWFPGENQAECLAVEKHAEGKFPSCSCGFYGYYDGSNDYYHEGYVSAVVEGYGEAVMGDRGFRVMKARILALSIDDKVQAKNAHLVRRNYPQIPIFESFRAMLAEYPTDYELDSPSPEDEDFWSRSA